MKRLLPHVTVIPCVALIGALTLVLTLGACDLTELNENLNEPRSVTPPSLLTNAESTFNNRYWNTFALGRFTNLYAQYWSQTQYVSESRYNYPVARPASVSNQWSTYYLTLNDLQEIIRIARTEPGRASPYGEPKHQIAIAEIMQTYIYQVLTDIWGPIPFEAALAGREDFTAEYASQETVYVSLVDSVSRAIGLLPEDGGTALTSGDLIFGGDLTKWKAFGNSLKMRLAIRMAETKPDLAETAFVAAYNGVTLDEIGADALIPFIESPQLYVNPIYQNAVINGRDDWGVSATLLSVMNAYEDPRRPAYAQRSPDGDYTGFPYGLPRGAALSVWAGGTGDFSRPSERVAYTATAPAILLTQSETLFMKAEAAQRGWITADPAALYEEAIRASMEYWDSAFPGFTPPYEITDAEIEAYLAEVPYDAAHWKQVLGVQKWIALYMQGLQGWSVFRRLDFDDVFVVPPGDPGQVLFGQHFPVRIPFPTEEPTLNTENYDAAVADFLSGEDTQATSLWWDGSEAGEPEGD